MATRMKDTSKTIDDAYSEALARYAHRDNITGIDIGYKYTDGQATETLAIRLHVKEKIPKSALETADLFPEEIVGFPVDVIQGNYKPGAQREPIPEATNRTTRFSRLQPGISVAHTGVTAGTLGMFVKDRRSGKPAILSNWHVLAGSATASPGDGIVQPGPHDGGRAPRDVVGALERMMLDKDGDAAIAFVSNARPFDPSVIDVNVVPDSLADPQVGDEVIKSGRTTQVTRGRVDGKGRYFITYPVGRVGIDGFIIVPSTKDNPTNEEISMGGDSGSIWIKDGTRTAVGLHFAGETDPRPSEEHAIACFVTRVFPRLDIQPWSAAQGIETREGTEVLSQLSNELGAAATAGIFDTIDPREIRRLANRLSASFPRLEDADLHLSELTKFDSSPEIGPLGAVAIGFAAGAAARIIGKSMESAETSSAEAFPVVVAAFLAGAVAGARAVDGKL
jgi:hypothetical protein